MRALYLLSYNGGGWCRFHSGSAPALGAEQRSTRQVMVVSTNATNATVVAVGIVVGVRSVRIGTHDTPASTDGQRNIQACATLRTQGKDGRRWVTGSDG